MIDDGQVVGSLHGLSAEEGDDGLAVVVLHSGLVEAVQKAGAGIVQQRDATERLVDVGGESADGVAHALSQALHHGFAVLAVVVFYGNVGHTLHFGDVEGYLEFRDIQLQGGIYGYLLSTDAVIAQHTYLVGVHDVGLEAVVGGDAGEGVVLVGEGLLEGVGTLMQELLHTLVPYLGV